MIKRRLIFFFILSLPHKGLGDPVINLFLKPYPDTEHAMSNLKNPKKLASQNLASIMDHSQITGIFATYSGYLDASNSIGEILFPRKHDNNAITLVITNRITPINMFENTIDHWELVENTPAEMYRVERAQDQETGLWYWNTSKIEIPQNLVLPLESVILIAKPYNMYVAEGVSITDNTPNLTLPVVYVKKGIKIIDNALYVLQLAHLFRDVRFSYQKEKNRYLQQIID